jgi:hypothetical protein
MWYSEVFSINHLIVDVLSSPKIQGNILQTLVKGCRVILVDEKVGR